MKLKKKQLLLIGFMLFSLFFGAGNLIFPPFLGNEAASNMPLAMLGFIIPAVVLPVLGVIIVAKFNGMEKLAGKVHPKFAIIFTIAILLSIGPGLGIPRAASVPFEMAIKPYLNENLPSWLFLLLYSLIFFSIALWLALNPKKLVNRIGYILTPLLLTLIIILFVSFSVKGIYNVGIPAPNYQSNVFLKGFCDGYQTMDTIAALNFGLVISDTIFSMGVEDNKSIVNYTVKTGIIAGLILSIIYIMLSFMGMATSGVYPGAVNGAYILREIVYQLFGNFGAIFIASIFTLACLTTCIGLISSISKYFSDMFPKLSYKIVAIIITVFSFVICNLGLNMIISISSPILDAIYPISIVLILLGLFDFLYKDNKFIYPITIASTAVISIIYSFDKIITPDSCNKYLSYIFGYDLGFGWTTFAVLSIIISIIIDLCVKHKNKKLNESSAV